MVWIPTTFSEIFVESVLSAERGTSETKDMPRKGCVKTASWYFQPITAHMGLNGSDWYEMWLNRDQTPSVRWVICN